MKRWGLILLSLVVAALVAPAAGAAATADCVTPASLCSGDPCTTTTVTVAPNCVLDFGARTLRIGGTMTVPNGGALRLSANQIEVNAPIQGGTTTGPNIELVATGNIVQNARIASYSTTTPGSVTLRSGGNVTLQNNV